MTRILLSILALATTTSASASDLSLGVASQPPEKISFLATFGEEKCPEAIDPDEIVVCATAPEGDRYRIPKDLRKTEDEAQASQSWTSAVESLDEGARATRPNSCGIQPNSAWPLATQPDRRARPMG